MGESDVDTHLKTSLAAVLCDEDDAVTRDAGANERVDVVMTHLPHLTKRTAIVFIDVLAAITSNIH